MYIARTGCGNLFNLHGWDLICMYIPKQLLVDLKTEPTRKRYLRGRAAIKRKLNHICVDATMEEGPQMQYKRSMLFAATT